MLSQRESDAALGNRKSQGRWYFLTATEVPPSTSLAIFTLWGGWELGAPPTRTSPELPPPAGNESFLYIPRKKDCTTLLLLRALTVQLYEKISCLEFLDSFREAQDDDNFTLKVKDRSA